MEGRRERVRWRVRRERLTGKGAKASHKARDSAETAREESRIQLDGTASPAPRLASLAT